jgi:hypothetical protein
VHEWAEQFAELLAEHLLVGASEVLLPCVQCVSWSAHRSGLTTLLYEDMRAVILLTWLTYGGCGSEDGLRENPVEGRAPRCWNSGAVLGSNVYCVRGTDQVPVQLYFSQA